MNNNTPEKTELYIGKMHSEEKWLIRMFQLLLYNIGVREAVKYALKEVWLKALEELQEVKGE